jgi:hypothetical protein
MTKILRPPVNNNRHHQFIYQLFHHCYPTRVQRRPHNSERNKRKLCLFLAKESNKNDFECKINFQNNFTGEFICLNSQAIQCLENEDCNISHLVLTRVFY